MNVSIYVLRDPETMEIRYVGRTKNSLSVRLNGHLSKAKQNKFKTHKDNWILSLPCKPIIEKIEMVYGWEESYKREQEIIKQYILDGFNLTNLHDRGTGGLLRNISDEMKNKISEKVKELHKNGLLSCNRKSVDLYDLNGVMINSFVSYKECAKFIGVSEKHLQNSIKRCDKRIKSYQVRAKGAESPGVWKQRCGEIVKNFKQIYAFDTTLGAYLVFNSVKEFRELAQVRSNGFYYYMNKVKLFKGRYIIANARVKLDELLESLESNR